MNKVTKKEIINSLKVQREIFGDELFIPKKKKTTKKKSTKKRAKLNYLELAKYLQYLK